MNSPIRPGASDATLQALLHELEVVKYERDDYARRLKATDRSWSALALERDNWRTVAQKLAGRVKYRFDVWTDDDLAAIQDYNRQVNAR